LSIYKLHLTLEKNMSKKIKIIGATAIIFSIAGCSSSTPVSKVINMRSDKVALVSNSAETTSSLYQSAINKSYYCSSNAPDSTFSTSKDFDFSVSLLNFGGGSPEKEHSGSSSSGAEMLGRSPAVLAARDIMYRACELIGNLNLTPEQATVVYTDSLKIAASILKTEAATTTITQTSTLGVQVSEGTATLPETSTENTSTSDDSASDDSTSDFSN
jgi:hypothetical protein